MLPGTSKLLLMLWSGVSVCFPDLYNNVLEHLKTKLVVESILKQSWQLRTIWKKKCLSLKSEEMLHSLVIFAF